MKKAILALVLIAFSQSARAETAGAWQADGDLSARLVSAATGVGDLAKLRAGLEIRLENGAKTYWRSPGDAGMPFQLDWAGSDNLKEAVLHWPTPHRYSAFGFENHVYDGSVLLPLSIIPEQPGKDIRLSLSLGALLCEEICSPATLHLSLAIPGGPAIAGDESPRIGDAFASLPRKEESEDLSIRKASFDENTHLLTVVAESAQPFSNPDIFIETTEPVSFDAPQVRLENEGRRVLFTIRPRPSAIAPKTLVGIPLTFTLTGGAHALETTRNITAPEAEAIPAAPPEAAKPAAAPAAKTASHPAKHYSPLPDLPRAPMEEQHSLPAIILIALLGGLILNVMPCVLPVLSLKLLSVLRHGGAERIVIRRGFLATAAGIVTSFLILASGIVLLRLGGIAVGWGFHFQEPVFIAFLLILMVIFSANMAGLFEIPIPAFLARHEGGHFLTGVLAAFMATPCSAPFLGVAVGYALSRGPFEIFAVFLALGCGLALPYMAVAIRPELVKALPKPGAWMVRLKQALAVALAAVAVWLGTVLAGQLLPAPVRPDGDVWQAFAPERIAEGIAEGKTVLVSATADWCLTCKANERLAYDSPEVDELLKSPHVVAMRADWTRRDESISDFMSAYGRHGVPFTIVFSGKIPQGRVLPELLSASVLKEALQ